MVYPLNYKRQQLMKQVESPRASTQIYIEFTIHFLWGFLFKSINVNAKQQEELKVKTEIPPNGKKLLFLADILHFLSYKKKLPSRSKYQ